MALFLLFVKHFYRQHILLVCLVLILGILFSLAFRNQLSSQKLAMQDRQFILTLKKNAQLSMNHQEKQLPAGKEDYEQELVWLVDSYLEASHKEGQNHRVLGLKGDVYRHLLGHIAEDGTVSEMSAASLMEKEFILEEIRARNLAFHYPQAPKDFHLLLYQVLPYLMWLLPVLATVLATWLLVADQRYHRGLLFTINLSRKAYAYQISLLHFSISFSLLAIWAFISWVMAKLLNYSSQADFPILVSRSPLTSSPVDHLNLILISKALILQVISAVVFVLFSKSYLKISKRKP